MASKYPYVEVKQLARDVWRVRLITKEIDLVISPLKSVKFARTRTRAEKKGRKMLAKCNKKYADLADDYVIR